MFPVLQHRLIIENKDDANVGSFAASPYQSEQRWRQCFQCCSFTWSYRTKMAPMFPVLQLHLIIQNKDCANVGSFPAALIIQNKDGANVGSFPASPDHTEQRWRQCWQFRSITWSYRTKMAPMLAVSQHHLIIQNKDGANVGSFAGPPDHIEQRWRQWWQFRSITWSYRTKMAITFPVSQHHLIIQNKVCANVFCFAASTDHTEQRWR